MSRRRYARVTMKSMPCQRVQRVLGACFAVSVLITQLPLQAQAIDAPYVIEQLGRSPVIGSIRSTAVLRAHAHELIAASKTLDLTQGESDALSDALLHYPKLFGYGPIPRHLDAMTGGGPDGYHVIRNVIIPPNQYGWELAFSHGTTRTVFYIPNRCGNVSIVRSYVPAPATPPPAGTPIPAASPLAAPTPAELITTPPAFIPSPTPVPANPWRGYAIPLYIIGACIIADLVTHKPWCGFGTGHGGGGTPPGHHAKPTPTPKPTPRVVPSLAPGPTPKPTATPKPTPSPSASASCGPTPAAQFSIRGVSGRGSEK